ncbi:MAG TPA: nitroreductase family protein [Alphaproteobacteria bacterium]|nr:nitroreductase family protein [Alphaproteobacteria bacterium]
MALTLSPDEVLTTTRSVRKRLDLTRSVPRGLIAECMEIAFQAPNGRNLSSWQWVVIDDPKVMAEVGRIYNNALSDFTASVQGQAYRDAANERAGAGNTAAEAERKMSESVDHLREIMGKLPAAVVPLFPGRPDKITCSARPPVGAPCYPPSGICFWPCASAGWAASGPRRT